ncbi:Immunity protein 26 of polymorphic toxin system [Salinibacterium sp. NYA9b]
MKKIVIGDVFIVPTGDGRAGVGQVVGLYRKSYYYFAIFDAVLPLEVAAERAIEALTSPVLFLALSLDAKIYVGHWTVVTRTAVHAAVRLPAYKVAMGTIDNIHVIDYSGTRSRPATRAEINFLQYRRTVAPAILEGALRASLGLEPWHQELDELKPDWVITTSAFFK